MLGKNAKLARLKEAPLFAECSRRELEQVASVADELRFPAGKTLIKEGATGREFLIVLDGDVEVRRKGRKLPPKGDTTFFGEAALLTGAPRNASVTAASDVEVLVITDRAFDRLLDESPSIRRKVLAALAARLPDA